MRRSRALPRPPTARSRFPEDRRARWSAGLFLVSALAGACASGRPEARTAAAQADVREAYVEILGPG